MDVIKYAEAELVNYGAMKRAATSAKYKVLKITEKTAPKPLKAAAMDATGIRSGDRAGNTESDMMEIQFWKHVQDENEKELERINDILDEIEKESKIPVAKVLKRWYIHNDSKEDIAAELNCTVPRIYQIKAEGLRLFALSLFGVKASNII